MFSDSFIYIRADARVGINKIILRGRPHVFALYMASVLRSYRFGIIALQSIRVLEGVSRPPCRVKVFNIVHACESYYSLCSSYNSDTVDIILLVMLNH